jgi:hypothetical protein
MVQTSVVLCIEVTRVRVKSVGRAPRRTGRRARLGRHVEGPDRERQLHGQQFDSPCSQHRRRHEGEFATGDLSKKITVDVKGEILELKNTINTWSISCVRIASK